MKFMQINRLGCFNTKIRIKRGYFYIFLGFLLISCGPKIIPDDLDAKIDPFVSFQDLLKNPENYIGKHVLLGGEIIETHVSKDHSEIELLQKPLDARKSPRLTDDSLGRFYISDSSFLDPAIYKSGRRITVVGIVQGSQSRKIGGAERTYPLLERRHLHLWPPESRYSSGSGPRFSIGLGAIFHD